MNVNIRRTLFYGRHKDLGAQMVDFGGWEMPIMYPTGIVQEHLATRKKSGLFDVSHMGRFLVRGEGALEFLQYVLSNNAEALDASETGAQYTFVQNETGGAIDDAYLYRFLDDEFLLVVNAANREKDWQHFASILTGFDNVELIDVTETLVMLSLQGPHSKGILTELFGANGLPEPKRNSVKVIPAPEGRVMIARTGYTGEPLCFEIFADRGRGLLLWDQLVLKGAIPIGLGARDTLRLEAGLPLYGHELGIDAEGNEIPVMACPLAKFAVSFSPLKGDFLGRHALLKQFEAFKGIMARDYSRIKDLPRMIKPVAMIDRGVSRAGSKIFVGDKLVGHVTSGTMVPYWSVEGKGLLSVQSNEHQLRSICLAYMDSDVIEETRVSVEIRGKRRAGEVVPFHMRSDAPPYARPILSSYEASTEEPALEEEPIKIRRLLQKTLDNTLWRQRECINLIPSEMTPSPMVRLLSVMDPAFRYAEHKKSEAFYNDDILYYQGTDFISEVEWLLEREMAAFLGCEAVETRVVSGQMANMAIFSALMDYLNRTDRKTEPRRIARVMCNHIGKGGHLSAQPMGALKDFVARDPHTERPAVQNFPVLEGNPYKMDVPATLRLIDEFRPELIILGKSLVIHKEPVREIRRFLDEQRIASVLMYDMAHVLGLIGSHFQSPFEEGADLVTGSTHKTFFGTQRGVIGSRYVEQDERYALWEAIVRRTFPGSVSNHHLGTLLGLLAAAYEMNHFRDEYQQQVIANAKAFAKALRNCGMDVAGDPDVGYTETHQVVVHVGYSKGPDLARRLEANNIICNYQAVPTEEGFTAAGGLRLGVSEMTRFGMKQEDFGVLAQMIKDVVIGNATVATDVKAFRKKFLELGYCFPKDAYQDLIQALLAQI